MDEKKTLEQFKAFRRAEWITDLLIWIPFASAFFYVLIPALGKPLLECYPRILLGTAIVIVANVIMRHFNTFLQAKFGFECKSCSAKPIYFKHDRMNLMKGECPRCLGPLPAAYAGAELPEAN